MTRATTALLSIEAITSVFWSNIQNIMPKAQRHTLGTTQAQIVEWMKNHDVITLYPMLSENFLNPLNPVSSSIPIIPTSEPIMVNKSTIFKSMFGHSFLIVPAFHPLRPVISEMHKEYATAVNTILSSIKKTPDLSIYPTCTSQILPSMPSEASMLFRLSSNSEPITQMQAINALIMNGNNMPAHPIDISSTEEGRPQIRLGFNRNPKASAEDNHLKLVLSSALILFFLSANNTNTTVSNDDKNLRLTSLFHHRKPTYIEKIDKVAGLASAEKNLVKPKTTIEEEHTFDLDLYFNNPCSEYIATARQAITDTICLVLSIIIQDARTSQQTLTTNKAPENFGQAAFHQALTTLIADLLTDNTILPTCDYMTEQTSLHTLDNAFVQETSVINKYSSHSISTYVRPFYDNVGLLPDNLIFYALEDVN